MQSDTSRGERTPSSAVVTITDDDEPGGVGHTSMTNVEIAGPMISPERNNVERLVALLEAKENELRVLQKTHDEYVKSSCEYEKELEGELERCEHKIQSLEQSVQSLEETHATLQTTVAQAQHDLTVAAKREEALAAQVEDMKWKIQRLEQTNDELETATRVAQASIDELQHRLEKLTEENVFLAQEKEDAVAALTPQVNATAPHDAPPENSTGPQTTGTGPRTASLHVRRKVARLPEVVESCLHITCSHDQCDPAATTKAVLVGTAKAPVAPGRKRKSFFARLRAWTSF